MYAGADVFAPSRTKSDRTRLRVMISTTALGVPVDELLRFDNFDCMHPQSGGTRGGTRSRLHRYGSMPARSEAGGA